MCRTALIVLFFAVVSLLGFGSAAAACRDHPLALQVLGSGGPFADDARASSGYLLWYEGHAVALIDAGGGVFQRFGAAGADTHDLDLIALTHFHVDHTADLPAILKSAYFSGRRRTLAISGPTGAGAFPPLGSFLKRLFGTDAGAFAYLSGLLGNDSGKFTLKPITIDADGHAPQKVFANKTFSVQAVGVHHGPVPTLGYLIHVGQTKIAISGDQNLSTEGFTQMIAGADLLVLPVGVPESKSLFPQPEAIGKAAATAKVSKLVLSHWMAPSIENDKAIVAAVKKHYHGPVVEAKDLQCLAL